MAGTSPAMTTRSLRRFRSAAVRFRPAGRIANELLDLDQHLYIELAARLRHAEHVSPGRERVHGDTEIAEDLFALRIDFVKEDHETMVADAARLAQRVDEIDLALAVGGEIFHQQHALAGEQLAFDLRAAAEAFGLLAHILHRQMQPVGDPGGEGNARSLATGDGIDLAAPDVALDDVDRKTHERGTNVGKRHQPARVVVNRARPAARKNERL